MTNGYLEQATEDVTDSGHVFREIGAEWVVPPKPLSWSSANLIYIFPGLQNNPHSGTPSIAQPVLQLGNNGYYSPGDSWIAALYICQGRTDPCHAGNVAMSVNVGDDLTGSVNASNCSGGRCDWTIEMADNTTLQAFEMTVTASMTLNGVNNGQQNDSYTEAVGGALETYNLHICDELPVGAITFFDFTLKNELGVVSTPPWLKNVPGGTTPQCGYAVLVNSTSVTLPDSATTAVTTSISGPESVASGASGTWQATTPAWPHLGTAPYSYFWSGILSGSGQSISGIPSGSGNLTVEVQDAAGGSYTTSLAVTVCAWGQRGC